MENSELLKEGERQHGEYQEALRKANASQLAEANREVQEHMSEYGHSFASAIVSAIV